jgi:penicillin amidase
VPAVYNPPGDRIWTANARVVGGEALRKLGFGGYAHGARARQIRDGLFARDRLEESDLLAIQLDDRGLVLQRWQELMLRALRAGHRPPHDNRLIAAVESWGGRAVPESIGYRLVRTFRNELLALVYAGYTAGLPALPNQPVRLPTNQADEPVWRLLTERPAHLVPPPHPTWDAVIDTALARVLAVIESEAGGRIDEFTWANANRAAIRHPLSRSVPGLSLLLDPGNAPQPGDLYQPRVAAPAFGASQRFVVAPGHENTGIFHMPGSQSGHPLSPYYSVGHQDWEQGRPTPFLPSEAKWRLMFRAQSH